MADGIITTGVLKKKKVNKVSDTNSIKKDFNKVEKIKIINSYKQERV